MSSQRHQEKPGPEKEQCPRLLYFCILGSEDVNRRVGAGAQGAPYPRAWLRVQSLLFELCQSCLEAVWHKCVHLFA